MSSVKAMPACGSGFLGLGARPIVSKQALSLVNLSLHQFIVSRAFYVSLFVTPGSQTDAETKLIKDVLTRLMMGPSTIVKNKEKENVMLHLWKGSSVVSSIIHYAGKNFESHFQFFCVQPFGGFFLSFGKFFYQKICI